jgi:hypothetical protein
VDVEAAWKPDPAGTHQLRYWAGQAWTSHVADAGVASVAPLPEGALLPDPLAGGASHRLLQQRAARKWPGGITGAQLWPFGRRAAPKATLAADIAQLAEHLRELGKLGDEGLLTDEEFAIQKARLLQG